MPPEGTQASSDRKVAPVYLVADKEIILDAPVDEAWPQVIDYPSWQDYSTVEHVSGPAGQEGEVVLLKKEEAFEFPPYYAITVKLEPEHRIIWKTYSLEDEEPFFGIVDFTVEEIQNTTRFSIAVVYEFQVSYQDDEQLNKFRDEQYVNFESLFAAVLPKLEKQVQVSKIPAPGRG